MSEYRVEVSGQATVRFDGGSGLSRTTEIVNDSVTVDGPPTVLTDGPATVTVERIDSND